MSTNRKSILGIVSISTFLIFVLGALAMRYVRPAKPLGESPLLLFQSTSVPDAAVRSFLDADFVIIKDTSPSFASFH